MHEPVVKFYKDRGEGGNGAFATSTTATSGDEFLQGCAEVLPAVLGALAGDEEFTFAGLLPQICEIWAKLNGYKSESVFEQRRLTVGEPNPEAHMDYLNNEPTFQPVN